mgnify:CR=1 FL=1
MTGVQTCALPICIEGEGDVVTEELDLSNFNSIESNGSFDVVIEYGETQKVVAVGHQNIINRLKTYVSSNTWEIELERGNYCNFDLTIYITIPYLKSAEINGSGNIEIGRFVTDESTNLQIDGSGNITFDTIVAQQIDLEINGSGSINGFVDCAELNASIDASGNIKTKGWADNQTIKIYGSGSYKGINTESINTNVKISASGDAYVNVSDNLTIRIDGSGNVYYVGQPRMNITINGSGRVIDQN